MCAFCGFNEELYAEEVDASEGAEARRRASQESWARLMDELARADAADAAGKSTRD